jgi:hypothetical protein
VKTVLKLQLWGAVLVMGASLAVSGCKSAPPLTQEDAQKLIQAYYDQQPPTPVHIYVDYTGLKQGTDAKYWKVVKVFPANKNWGDLDLTDEGKKVYKLDDGSTTIHWRPDEQNKGHFYISTAQANHSKISEVSEPQDDVVPGVDTAKSCKFTTTANLDGMPDPVKQMAHDVGNILTQRHTADLALENGAWKVHAIR